MYGILPEIQTTSGETVRGWPCEILNPPKLCVLRLPTNSELAAYMSSQRTIVFDLGRNKSRSEDQPTPDATARLFNAIRLDKHGIDFDDAEMNKAIGLLCRHKLVSCERDGQNYIVKLATPFDDEKDGVKVPTTHVVAIPFEKDAADYRRAVVVETSLPDNKTEQRFPIEAPVRLYDKILLDASGYFVGGTPTVLAAEVPVNHKRTVVNAVMGALQQLEPSLDPN